MFRRGYNNSFDFIHNIKLKHIDLIAKKYFKKTNKRENSGAFQSVITTTWYNCTYLDIIDTEYLKGFDSRTTLKRFQLTFETLQAVSIHTVLTMHEHKCRTIAKTLTREYVRKTFVGKTNRTSKEPIGKQIPRQIVRRRFCTSTSSVFKET